MKVLISDFDGTLYFENGIKKQDLEALEEFRSKGNLFGICTEELSISLKEVVVF